MLFSSCCWPTAEPKCGAFSGGPGGSMVGSACLRLPTLYCRTTLQRRLSNRCYVPPDDRFAPYAGVGVCRRSRRAGRCPVRVVLGCGCRRRLNYRSTEPDRGSTAALHR